MSAQTDLEQWISETAHRHTYEGTDVILRLRRLQEYMGDGDTPPANFVKHWLLMVTPEDNYRSSIIQNNLLDLYNLLLADAKVLFDQDAPIISA